MANQDDPLISVIVPCYNQGQYLDEAVDSILAQTYQNFEIIIINDGSTEPESIKILNNYHKPKSKVIHTSNQGVCRARNTAIETAQGKYIFPLDADDKIAPTYLEKALKIIENNLDVGIVYCETILFGDQEGTSTSSPLPKIFLGKDSLPEILLHNRIHNSALYLKSDWELVNGYNPNMIYGLEDYDFWLSILETGKKAYLIEEYLYFWRKKEVSRTTLAKQNLLACYTQLFENHQDLYLGNMEAIFDHILNAKQVFKTNFAQQRKIEAELKETQAELEQVKKLLSWQNRIFHSLAKKFNSLSKKISKINRILKLKRNQ